MKRTSRKRRVTKNRKYSVASFIAGAFTVILVLTICFGVGSFYSNAQEEPAEQKLYKSIQIQDGDSLWSIAKEYMNDDYDSVYDYMAELVELNQLDENEVDHLQEGDYLTIAYYDTVVE